MEKLFKKSCIALSILIVVCSVAAIFTAPQFAKSDKVIDLFDCNSLIEKIENLEMNLTSTVYVKNKQGDWVEYQRLHGIENRIWVSYDKMPKSLIDAFVSIEDQRFYEHSGVDWKRTFSAFGNLIFKYYSTNQGGSTITQQLIKNISGDNEQNSTRKIREICRALYLEKKLSKEQIMEAYLNTISLGNGICGVQVAANYYFNKDVSDLNLSECAAIASITKNPSLYNPERFPEKNKERRLTVLKKMHELEKINDKDYAFAFTNELEFDFSQKNNYEFEINNYFIDALIDEVIEDIAEKYDCSTDIASSMFYNGGYKIYSTLDKNIQGKMEKVYNNVDVYFKQIAKKAENAGNHAQSSMTIMDYQGHIVGMVGGAGQKTTNRGLNRATDSPRQPGSTMKPIGVYAQAIENGIANYSSMVLDQPIENYYGSGKAGPKEWYGYYKGNITVQYALEKSANTIPVRLLKEVGVETSYKFLTEKLHCNHLTDVDKNLASLALGGCQYGLTTTESAAAYAIFGNGGKYYEPTTYYKVEKNNGEVILESKSEGEQVIKESTATIMNKLLQKVVYGSEGTGGRIASYSNMKVYAKTGTSSESNDLWMVAGTPYYVGSVWYGFDVYENIKDQGAAATIWRDVMKPVHSGLKTKDFAVSKDVVERSYCAKSGKLAGEHCATTLSGFYDKDNIPGACEGAHAPETPTDESSSEDSTSSSSSTTGSSSNVSHDSEHESHGDTSGEGETHSQSDNRLRTPQ